MLFIHAKQIIQQTTVVRRRTDFVLGVNIALFLCTFFGGESGFQLWRSAVLLSHVLSLTLVSHVKICVVRS